MSRDSNNSDDMSPLRETSTWVVRNLNNLLQSYHSGLGYLIILRSATVPVQVILPGNDNLQHSLPLIWLQGLFFSKIVPYLYRGRDRQQIIQLIFVLIDFCQPIDILSFHKIKDHQGRQSQLHTKILNLRFQKVPLSCIQICSWWQKKYQN